MGFPRIIISALHGGSGKTIISIGIIAALRSLGEKIVSFKKGPDYIDAGWLSLAAGGPCYNLDTFLVSEKDVLNSFLIHSSKSNIAVIEGNRGLYDGIDINGSTCTAELAKLLEAPVVLCLDCTKSTRTMAASVLGCIHFAPEVKIAGVILNRVAGKRHENILRRSIEYYTGLTVFGALPKLDKQIFPERHMGLVPTTEHEWAKNSIKVVSKIAKQYINLDALDNIAREAANIPIGSASGKSSEENCLIKDKNQNLSENRSKPKIGIARDSAFQFYYPENIEALASAGAELVFLSPLKNRSVPLIDALYIGGGFPETHANELSENALFRNELRLMAKQGLPIYAECGGLMYLGEELILEEKPYPMAGILPVAFGLSKKPRGHGYTIIDVSSDNPYFQVGTKIRAHEFHYSFVLKWKTDKKSLVFRMERGAGIYNKKDGIRYKNVLATYSHLHALGTPSWAKAMVRNAISFKKTRQRS